MDAFLGVVILALVSWTLQDAEAFPLKDTVKELEQRSEFGGTTTTTTTGGIGSSSSSRSGGSSIGGIGGGLLKQGSSSSQEGSFNSEVGFWQKLRKVLEAVDTASMAIEITLSEMMDTLQEKIGMG